MTRLDDWPERLAAYFDERRATPFAWGMNDCAQFVRGAVRAMTGAEVASAALDAYDDKRAALKVIAKGGGLLALTTQAFGEPVALAYVRRGDVVLYTHPQHGPALGVCNGVTFAAPGDVGMEFADMAEATHVWRIG